MDRLDIMYEDQSVLVLRKPAGTAVQTARLAQRDMVSMAKNYLASGGNRNPYVGVVHRLDQPVEGLLVMAKTPEAAAFSTAASRPFWRIHRRSSMVFLVPGSKMRSGWPSSAGEGT